MGIDVFISHHTESSLHIVEAIATKLEAIGLRCWYAPRDTEGPFAGSITDAVEGCRAFILVLNKASSNSFWVKSEINLICNRLSQGEPVHVIPFHTADPKAELNKDVRFYLGQLHWLEAIDPPMHQRIDELVEHLARQLGATPAAEEASVSAAHRLIGKMPQARDVFCGRERQLEQIHAAFTAGKRAVFLEGIGGIGKSELAKQYALAHPADYDQVVFATYTSDLEDLFWDPAALVIEGLEPQADENTAQYFDRKLRVLQSITNERTLLIIDNFDVEDDPRLGEFLTGHYRVLFTTRNAHKGYPSIRIETIQDPDALMEIFESNYGSALEEEERQSVLKIFEYIEYHTYAIELIAKQMEASFLSADEMLERLQKGRMEEGFRETVSGRHHVNTAFGHICSVFNTGMLTPEEKQLLSYLSLAGHQGIPGPRFREWASLDSFEAVNGLIRRSWIRKEGSSISLHPLVREVVFSVLKPTVENTRPFLQQAANYCYNAWYRPYAENRAVGDCILSIQRNFPGGTPETWHIFNVFFNFLWQIGLFEDSILYSEKCFDTVLQAYGNDSMITGFIAKGVGGCYFNSGRAEESIPWYKRGLECMLASGAPESEDLAMSYEKVARCYTWSYERDLALSEEYFSRSKAIRLRLLEQFRQGSPRIEVRDEYRPKQEREQLTDAQLLFMEALYQELDLSLAYGRLGEVYMEMGRMYQAAGDFENALLYAEKDLKLLEEHFPENRSGIAYAYYDMGVCRFFMALQARKEGTEAPEMLQAAEKDLRIALESNRKMRGELALDTADNYEYLADVLAAGGRYAEASNEYMAAVNIVESLLGNDHPRYLLLQQKMDFHNAPPFPDRPNIVH